MRRTGICLLLVVLFAVSSPLMTGGSAFAQDTPEEDLPLTGDFVPGQLIIRFKPGVTPEEIANFYAEYGLAEREELDSDPADSDEEMRLVAMPPQVDLSVNLVEMLENDERIEFAEPNYLLHIDETAGAPAAQVIDKAPNDPDYSKLWGLNNTGQTGGTADVDIDAPEAWEVSTGSKDIIVTVIDTGVDYKHEDLMPNLWVNTAECPQGVGKCVANSKDDDNNGYIDDFHGINAINDSGDPMDDYGHGTHVAGTIGAAGNNNLGVVGVNWNVRIMACKFLGATGGGSVAAAVKCFQYVRFMKNNAKQNIVLTNDSWGGAVMSEALREAMAGADQPMHVCAAGNGDSNVPHFPAAFDLPNILAVAATDHNDEYASFSNYGPWVDLAAPGVDVLSTVPKGSCPICSPTGYDAISGTSMATPHVSGALALVWSQYKTLTHEQVKQRLLAAGDPVRDRSKQTITNSRLNLLNMLENDTTPPATVTDLGISGVLLTRLTLRWTAPGDDGLKGKANAYDIRYSTSPISDANWAQATPVEGAPAPQPPGTVETFTVGGLEPGKTYYFAMKVLDNVGNASELSNVVVGKTSSGTIVFADDMESGPAKWTTGGTNNLWHLSQLRSNSPVTAWYYGKEDTRHYDTTPNPNNGTLTSTPIEVAGSDDALLTFYEWSQVQTSARLDRTRVQVSTDGQAWETIFESHGTEDKWVQRSVSLSGYLTATGTIQVRFWFDSVDATANNFEGWYVDDVQVLTAKLEAPGAKEPKANLVMQDTNILFNPADPAAGETVTVHATVLNNGTAEANDVVVQFMEVTNDIAIPIGQPQTISNIPVGGSGTAQVELAPSERPGERTIEVVVDPNNFVPEINEADNSATQKLTVAAIPAANLKVASTNIGFEPPAPNPGDQVTIRATIFNTGTVEARNVSVQFADVTGSGSTPIGEPQTIDVIPPGGSAVVETTFDTAGAPGDRDIEVAVDVNNTIPETNESDNKAEKPLKLALRFAPNLNVQSANIGFSPPSPTAGQVVTIYATILNDGNAEATGVSVQFMEVFGSTSYPIGPQQTVDVIPVGGSALVQIAYDTTDRPGDRKLEVMVDPNNFIPERSESDNKAQKTLKVTSPSAPNLVVLSSNINFSPAEPIEGEQVTIYATVLNNGMADATDVVVQFVDATNGAALPISDTQVIPLIPAGGSGVAQVTYDTTGKVGDRTIQVVADPTNFIMETDETDNSARDGLRVSPPPAPNLVMLASNISFYPPTPTDLDPVTIHAVVLNTGQIAAENVLVQFIDLTSGSATPIGGEQYIDLIPAGGSASVQATLDIGSVAPGVLGARRIQVLVDSNNLIPEANETDNTALKILPIIPSAAPNLVMLAENIGFNPPTPTDGEVVTISAVVLNRGVADAQNVVVQFVNMTSGRPMPIGQEQVIDIIPVGGSGVAVVTLDSSGLVGEHLIRVVVDPNNLIPEADETDNRNTATLNVVLPATANLQVQPNNIGFSPPNPVEGEPVSVTVTILNNGVVTASNVLVQFVDVTDGGFVPIGAKQTIPAILPGESATAQVTYDTTGKAGERKIQVLADPHSTIPEANEADNNATQTLIVAPSPAPNLVVQEGNIGFNPAAPNAGEVVSITATIINNGLTEARNVTVQFLDITSSGSGVPIAESQTIEVIPPGGSATAQAAYDTAGRSGDRRIQVVADAANLIRESNETDNVARKTLKVATRSAPNLVIQASNIGFDPPAPSPGDQVTIYATVINDGSAAANNVVVQFVDATNSASTRPIGEPQTIPVIPAGGSGLARITYDTTGMTGDRRIQVVVDPNNFIPEAKETDNNVQKTLTLVTPSQPNLSVLAANIGFTPASPTAGDSVTIIATVFNDGNAPANNVLVQFVDATTTPSTPIGQPQTIDVIPVGGSGSVQVTLDTAGLSGSRRIQVVVDPNNFIVERSETDNTATRTLAVTALPIPNLVVQAANIGFNPPSPEEGDQVIVSVVILNNGGATASDVTVQLVDATGGTPVPVGSPQVLTVIPAGTSGTAQFVYNTTGKVGDRTLQVVADPNNFIPESNEEDNQAVSTLTVMSMPAPNLTVLPGNVKFDPPAPEQGDVVTLTVTILNDGNADANDVVVQIAEIVDGVPVPIGTERTIDTIPAGSSSTLQILYENTTEPGERTIQVTVDPSNIVAESNETDNQATKSLTITPPIIPNLVIQPGSFTFSPPTPIEGDPVTVTVTVINDGTGDVSDVVVQVVDVTDGGMEIIGEPATIPTIPAGGSGTFSVTYATEEKVGDRRIQVVADPENTIAESDEDDNAATKTLRVVSEAERPEPQANLVVRSEAIQFSPITATVGSPVTVTVTVSNTGEANATDVVVEFTDITGGGSEVIGRQQITGTLPAGRNGRARVIYDTTGKTGARTIQVTADPDDSVTETDETDNQATRTLTLTQSAVTGTISLTSTGEATTTEAATTTEVATTTQVATTTNATPAQPAGAVLEQPNLAVLTDDIAIFRPDYVLDVAQAEVMTITVAVRNTGVIDANNVGVQLAVMTNAGWDMLGAPQLIERISAGSSATITATYEMADPAGYGEVRVLVDPDDAIFEADEGDNRASRLLMESGGQSP